MKIYLAADHAGFELKEKIKEFLVKENHEVVDCGAYTYDPNDDYPDFIAKAAKVVSIDPEKSKAVILGGSGQGEAIVANKFPNVRAVVYYGENDSIVLLCREHNDANVLSFGARFISEEEALKAVRVWLTTPFSGESRHKRRIKKIGDVERKLCTK